MGREPITDMSHLVGILFCARGNWVSSYRVVVLWDRKSVVTWCRGNHCRRGDMYDISASCEAACVCWIRLDAGYLCKDCCNALVSCVCKLCSRRESIEYIQDILAMVWAQS